MWKVKTGILFKSEVGMIDTEYTAGAERMFLQDIEIFEEERIDYKAFCAGKFIKRKGFRRKVERLYYPRFLLRLIREIENKFPNRLVKRLTHWLLAILDLFYCFYFILKTKNCSFWYAHQVPVLALINPGKAIIAFRNFQNIPFFRLFKSRYLRSKFYFCSQNLRDRYFQAHRGLESARSRVIYNGVDLKKFHPEKRERKKGGLNFLYASSWDRAKGIFLLLTSIKLLENKDRFKNKFLIAGSPDLWYSDVEEKYQSIDRRVKRLAGQLKTVKFLGRVRYSEWRRVYRDIDCLIFPSIWEEPFGNTIIEALACGVPVVAFKTGGIPEILEDGVNGFLLKEKSPQALAAKIEELSSQPEILTRMRAECLKVAKKFSKEVRQKRLIEFLGCKP